MICAKTNRIPCMERASAKPKMDLLLLSFVMFFGTAYKILQSTDLCEVS